MGSEQVGIFPPTEVTPQEFLTYATQLPANVASVTFDSAGNVIAAHFAGTLQKAPKPEDDKPAPKKSDVQGLHYRPSPHELA